MKKFSPYLLKGLTFSILLMQSTAMFAQGTVSGSLTKFQSWLNPILNIVVAICLLVSFVGLIIALASKSQDIKAKAIYFLLALALWAAKAVIFSDIAGIVI